MAVPAESGGKSRVILAPSILSADMARLGEQVREVEEAGAERLHLDMMDGHFVPNLTFGPLLAGALRPVTRLPLVAHLMVEEPERLLPALAEVGVSGVIVHVEASVHLHRIVAQVHDMGMRAGVALNPATPLAALDEILPELDEVLVMSVNPGFGGQRFIPSSLDKIARLRQMLQRRGLDGVALAVDGGLDEQTIPPVLRAGADLLVIGWAIFGAADGPAVALRRLRRVAEEAR